MNQKEMRINTGPGKTEFMVVARRHHNCELSIGEQRISKVEKCKYLGVHLDQNNEQATEIDMRIRKYNNTLALLYPIFREKNIPRQCKTTMYTIEEEIAMIWPRQENDSK